MSQERAPDWVYTALRSYGSHSLAYAILQPGMEYFGDERGVIAYRRRLGRSIVLGDPVCPRERLHGLVARFYERSPYAFYMQIHRATVDALQPFGYWATPVGVEDEIDTGAFSIDGKRKRDLRHYRNKALKGGVVVTEEADTPALRAELEPVSRDWLPLKSRHGRELGFLARPFVLAPEPDVRLWVARIDGAPAGFTVYDPMYLEGEINGYTVTILRHLKDSPEGTVDYINLCAIDQLRSEGIRLLSLGVSPFHCMPEHARREGRGNLLAYLALMTMNRWGDPIYHFRGLSFHKSRYRAQEVPVFCAGRGMIPVGPLIASARATGMV